MRGCQIAIVDSGIHLNHPHAGGVIGGVGIGPGGERSEDFVDRLGHGTAVAAAIHEMAPEAELWIVRIFERELRATVEQLVAGLEWALDRNADVINLSLGTTNPEHRRRLLPIVERAVREGRRIVSARSMGGIPCLPGAMEGVTAVEADAATPRGELREEDGWLAASPYPRPIPGVPVERNLRGISFAVANASGILAARILAGRAAVETPQ